MLGKLLIYLFVLAGLAVQAHAENSAHFAVGISEGVAWHFRWDNGYHRKGTLDIERGEFRYKLPTIRNASGPNFEVRLIQPLYKNFALTLTGSCDVIRMDLFDDLGPNYPTTTFEKTFDLRLRFYTISARLQLLSGRFSPYAGFAVGYAHGSLKTTQYFGSTQGEKNFIGVKGDGGGSYIDFILGTSIRILSSKTGMFIEVFHRRASDWKPFAEDEIFGDVNDVTMGMKEIDRDITRMHGLWIKIGLLIFLK